MSHPGQVCLRRKRVVVLAAIPAAIFIALLSQWTSLRRGSYSPPTSLEALVSDLCGELLRGPEAGEAVELALADRCRFMRAALAEAARNRRPGELVRWDTGLIAFESHQCPY